MNNFFLRLILAFMVGTAIVGVVANAIVPGMRIAKYEETAKNLAAEVAIGSPSGEEMLSEMGAYNLAWYFLTVTEPAAKPKQPPVVKIKGLAPNIRDFKEQSQVVSWRGNSYYDAVARVPGKQIVVHVGFAQKPPVDLADLSNSELPMPLALLLVAGGLVSAALCYFVSVTLPVRQAVQYFQRKDSGAAVEEPKILKLFPSDCATLMKLLSSRDKILTEKEGMLKDRESSLRTLRTQYEEEVSNAKKEKTVMFLKEAENNFLERLVEELDKQANVEGIAEGLLKQLNVEFPNSVEFALFFSLNKRQEHVLVAHLGFNNNPAEVYKGLGTMKMTTFGLEDTECKVLDISALREPQLREIAELTGAREVFGVPLRHVNRLLASVLIFHRGQQSAGHVTRVLTRAAQTAAKSLNHIAVYEEQVEAARTDELTGFPNKTYLNHLLPQLLGETDNPASTKQFAFLLVEGHDILAINEKHGRPVGDQIIQELGRRIDKLLQQRRNESMGGWGDHLVRYQGSQFMVILHSVDSKKAAIFAQRMRQVLEAEDWPGVGKWPTAIGIANFPEDTRNPEELIVFVETALSYARGQNERNKIAHISQVPKAFRSAKLASNLGGSLDVFDPAALMQSLSISRKSGILTVTHQDGKMFWCYLENGRPTKARLGKFRGSQAIVEFLVLFDSGDFNFTDYTSIDKQTLEDIRKLDKAFDCGGSLERTLMDGALARDHFVSGRDVIKQLDLFVWPIQGAQASEQMAKMRAMKDPPSPEEEKAMAEILKIANGKVTLKVIFERLDTLQTHLLWRSAALLVQHEVVQLKKLATSIGV